ncbi:MAG: hypothetical protein HUK17_04785, partial [Bacteroidales bacterium]|nr:hypothetical protein [Bacteroidales bacterium]
MSWLCKDCETENPDSSIKCEVCDCLAPVVETYLSNLDAHDLAERLESVMEAIAASEEGEEFYELVNHAVYKVISSKKEKSLARGFKGGKAKAVSDNPLSFTVNGVSFNMVKVEGGTFTMGATP